MGTRPCACCGYLTLDDAGLIEPLGAEEGNFQNCPVCGWEDDYAARADPWGPNSNGITLIEAQENFVRLGAFDEQLVHSVRSPLPAEFPPDAAWPEGR